MLLGPLNRAKSFDLNAIEGPSDIVYNDVKDPASLSVPAAELPVSILKMSF